MAISLPWLTARHSKTGSIGLALGPDGVAVVCINHRNQLGFCEFYQQPGDLAELIGGLITANNWQDMGCSVVLHPVYYQLLLAEAPAVASEELSLAVRWKVKELLDFPLDDAAIEYFLLPEDAYRGRQKMLYVAALRKTTLRSLIAPVEEAGLRVDTIEISELAVHNITSRMAPGQGGTVLVHLQDGEGFINIIENGEIYLSRRLDTGLEKLATTGNKTAVYEDFLLEIQRSLDFYESQLGKGIVTQLYCSPAIAGVKPIVDYLNTQLGLNVDTLALTNLGLEVAGMDDEQVLRCTTAIGAAIRFRQAGVGQGANKEVNKGVNSAAH